jgi:3',5'-cyclic AMP phosphodiesterase CpdA
MTRIAHVTDLHFGATDPAVVEALAGELNAGGYDLVAISGDLTMGARGWEFRAARAFIDGLSAPALAVPGNHDVSPYRLLERMVDPWRRWRAEIARETEPVWSDGRGWVAG